MNFYQIRLKRHPHLYIPKKGVVYALKSDQLIACHMEQNYNNHFPTIDATLHLEQKTGYVSSGSPTSYGYNYVSQKAGRVYTDLKQVKSIRRNYGFLNPDIGVKGRTWPHEEQTFSEFEVVEYPSEKVYPLDDFKS